MSRESNPRLELFKLKLEKVKPAGKGFIARCPAHDDRAQSLSFCVGRKPGSVLLNCFAGCSSAAILEAMDLTMEDLFENDQKDLSPEAQAALHAGFAQAKWAAALSTLKSEALFLHFTAKHLRNGEELDAESQLRLERSPDLLFDAYTTLSTGPKRPRITDTHKPKIK